MNKRRVYIMPYKQGVEGSNPSVPTKKDKGFREYLKPFFISGLFYN